MTITDFFTNNNNKSHEDEKKRTCIDTIYLTLRKTFDENQIPENRIKVSLDNKNGYFIAIGKENLEGKTDSANVLKLSIALDDKNNPELTMIDYYKKNGEKKYQLTTGKEAQTAKEEIKNYILTGEGRWILPALQR